MFTALCAPPRDEQHLRHWSRWRHRHQQRARHCHYQRQHGVSMAVCYTKLHNRPLRPLMAARQPQAPPDLRDALRVIDHQVSDYVTRARLGKAASKPDTNAQKLGTKDR